MKFKKNDLITITVNSSDLEAVKPFNLVSLSYGLTGSNVTETSTKHKYLIDEKGEIDFPILGKLKIDNLTKNETVALIKSKIDPVYVKNPSINIEILNFRVSVLGDVRNPGTYLIPDENVTVLDAIALAGDLNITGVREIVIKRREDDKLITGIVDLKSNDFFTSPFYFLQQNDVVYVDPNKTKAQASAYNQNTGVIVSIASILISLIAVLTR
jgi:polysaccharide export outer membrane protein